MEAYNKGCKTWPSLWGAQLRGPLRQPEATDSREVSWLQASEELRAVLAAYLEVKNASWPDMHPRMAKRSTHWPGASEAELRTELAEYVKEASAPTCSVRVFWKIGPKYAFAGCNDHFASDAGLAPADLIGLDDFDKRLPWQAQAMKYRADDKEVFTSGKAKLDILERQTSASGTVIWVRVGKTPIRTAAGSVVGILGMYELLDDKAAQKIFFERSRAGSPAKT